MATEGERLRDGTLVAAIDLSAKQYFAVKLSTSVARNVTLVAASTDDVLGILENKPVAGAAAEVAEEGTTKASAGAAITMGAKVMANTSGQMIPWVSGAGNCLMGWAEEAASGANIIFTMRLHIAPVLT